jgi:hypothetical protein
VKMSLIAEDQNLPSINSLLSWVDGVPQLTVSNPNTWVGDQQWLAVGTVDGKDLAIPLTLRNAGTNKLTVVSPSHVLEGDTGLTEIEFSIVLEMPAGELIQIGWTVQGGPVSGVEGSDFLNGVLPSGLVSFQRGESVKTVTFQVAADKAVEGDELMQVRVSLANAPATELDISTALTPVVLANDDQITYQGTATYWKNGAPLNLMTGWVLQDNMALDSAASLTIRNAAFDRTAATLDLEVWLDAAVPVANLDMHFSKPVGAAMTATRSADVQDWTFLENDQADKFTMAAIGSTPVSGTMKLMDLQITDIAPHQNLFLTRGTVGNEVLSSRSLMSANLLEITDGVVKLNAVQGDYKLFDLTAPGSSKTSSAIDSRDALMALKIANGSLGAADLESPYQLVAADVNKSGTVNALDAWLILRELVGYEDNNVGSWQLLNGTVDAGNMSSQKAWLAEFEKYTFESDLGIYLIGVIRGDVDGSLAPLPLDG